MISLIALSALAFASASDSYNLVVKSADAFFQNKGVSAVHFGAGLNGALLADSSEKFQLNETLRTVYQSIQTTPDLVPYTLQNFYSEFMFQAGSVVDDPLSYENGYLTYNGSADNFYACKTLPYDPYGFTKNPDTYGFRYFDGDAAADCTPIKIAIEKAI